MATPETMKAGKAGGLIGPESGQAFVWGKARPVAGFPKPHLALQLGPSRALGWHPGRGVCKAESEGREDLK